MTSKSYRFGVVLLISCCAALAVVAAVHRPVPSQTTEIVQTKAWAAISPGQALLAFHALFLSLIGLIGGTIGCARLNRTGPYLLLFGGAALLTYFQFEPRASSAETPLTVQLAGLLVLGMIAPGITSRSESAASSFSWIFYLMPGLLMVLCIQWLRTRLLLPAISATPTQELLLSASFTLIGALWSLATRGAAKSLFDDLFRSAVLQKSTGKATGDNRGRRQVFQTLLLTFFLGSIVSFFVIDRAQPMFQQWILMAPLIPAVMAIYAPFTWMNSDSPATVFQPGTDPVSVQQMRFFLGVMFQYLTVGTAVAIFQALKHPTSTFRLWVGVLFVVIYWLPALWFLWALGRAQGASVFP